ncbi:MAG: C39 family peptidase, partial [Candidatus Poribacteria bacterium]
LKSAKVLLLIIFLCFLIYGCSTLSQPHSYPKSNSSANISGTEGPLPAVYQLHDVPHNPRKQKGTDCAPDSLRMVLTYRGRNVGEQDITRQLTNRGAGGGTTFGQMQEIAVNSYGLPTFVVHNCDLDSIKSAIVNKMPPIIAYRSGGRNFHAVVGVGYDDKRSQIFVHDPNILSVRKMRYSDLGGFSDDGLQRLSCLFVLPSGTTEDEFKEALAKYIPKENVTRLIISTMYPSGADK